MTIFRHKHDGTLYYRAIACDKWGRRPQYKPYYGDGQWKNESYSGKFSSKNFDPVFVI